MVNNMMKDVIGLGKPTTLAKELWDWKEGWDLKVKQEGCDV